MSILHKLPVEEACRLAWEKGRATHRQGLPKETTFQGDPAAEAYEEAIDGINYVREEQRQEVDRGPRHDVLVRLSRIEQLTLELADAWREYIERRT